MKRTHAAAGVTASLLLLASVTACGQSSASQTGGSGATQSPSASVSEQKVDAVAKLVPQEVASSGIIKVGTSADTTPEGFVNASGQLDGYEIDIVQAVAATAGLKVDWQKTDFAALIPGLKANRFSAAVGQIGVTAEREKNADFVTLVLTNQAFAARKDAGLSNITISSLCGKKVAITQGSSEQDLGTAQSKTCQDKGQPAVDLNVFQSSNDAWLSTKSGRTELYWSGATELGYLASQDNTVEVVGHNKNPAPTGIALDKNSPMGPAVAAGLQHIIDDGSYKKILDKWGLEGNAMTKAELNPQLAG